MLTAMLLIDCDFCNESSYARTYPMVDVEDWNFFISRDLLQRATEDGWLYGKNVVEREQFMCSDCHGWLEFESDEEKCLSKQ